MNRDSAEFSLAVMIGALAGAALALALREAVGADADTAAEDRPGDGGGLETRKARPVLPTGGARVRARAIRLPAGARGFLGRPPRR